MIKIIILIVLIFFNGLLSASEIAFISLNKSKVKLKVKNGIKKYEKIFKLLESPNKFLATIQIGITIAGFLASAYAAETFANPIVDKLIFIGLSRNFLKTVIVIIVTFILSYFTLVFGELVPKRIALYKPDKVALLTVDSITALSKFAYPFVLILTKSTNLVIKLLKINPTVEDVLTEEDIKFIIAEGLDKGVIEKGETELIYNVFQFNDTAIKDIMTPKKEMVMVSMKSSFKSIFEVIKESKYTRIPVYSGNKNNVVGIINVKDIILNYNREPDEAVDIKSLMRKPYFTKLENKIDDVFKEMQNKNEALAIVKSTKKVVGLVTLEDLIEEIVGNIFDEYDERE